MGGLLGGIFAAATGNWWALGAQVLSGAFGRTQGTRLKGKDLIVQTAEEGEPLPRGWGTWRQSGVLVWCPGLQERRSGSKLKGTRRWSYATSFYVLGGRGPITRVNKIWLNQNLVYDYNNGAQQGFTLSADPEDGHFSGQKNGVGVRVYIGHPYQKVDPALQAAKGVNGWTGYPNHWGIVFDGLPLEDYGNAIPTVTAEVYYATRDIPSIIQEIGAWVGLASTDWDLSALSGVQVEGYVVSDRRAASEAIAPLMDAYHFALPEVDGVLRAVRKSHAPVATLTARDVRVTSPGSETPNVVWEAAQDKSIAQVVEIVTSDPARRYHPGYRYARRASVDGRGRRSLSYPLAMPANQAERLARIKVHEGRTQAQTRRLARDLKYLHLAAGDCLTLDLPEGASTTSTTVRLPQITLPLFGPIEDEAREHDPALYGAPLPSLETPAPPQTVPQLGALQVVAINTHVLEGSSDELSQSVLWLAVGGTGTARRGARILLDKKEAKGRGQQQSLTFPDRAVIGTALAALPLPPEVPVGDPVPTAEIKSIFAVDVPADGTLTLPATSLGAGGTIALAVNETAASLKTKLNGLPGYNDVGVTVTGAIQNEVPVNRATLTARASSAEAFVSGHPPPNAVDGDDTTYWSPSGLAASWVYDLGDGFSEVIKAYAFHTTGGADSPQAWILYGSNDGSGWEGITNRAAQTLAPGRTLYEMGLNTKVYRYLKFVFSQAQSASTVRLNTIELLNGIEGNSGTLTVTLGGALEGEDMGVWGISGAGWSTSTTREGGLSAVDTVQDFDAWDEGNTLSVDLPYGHLVNASDADVLAGANRAWLQSGRGQTCDWEIIAWRTATYDAAGSPAGKRRYVLSGLRRGQRSTWMHAGNHAAGDLFVLIDDAVQQTSWSGLTAPLTVGYEASYPDGTLDGDFTITRANLRPIPPYDIAGTRDANGWTLTWKRRDRQADAWEDPSEPLPYSDGNPPLFDIRFLNSGGAEVYGKIVSGTHWTFATAEHAILNSDTIRVRIRQHSASIANVDGYFSPTVEITDTV